MFQKNSPQNYISVLQGIKRKTLAFGKETLMTEFLLTKGSTLPSHAHPQEQTGYLVKGHVRLKIGADVYEVQPGDSWSIPGNLEHGAQILEDSVAIEVFSPVRKDYLPNQ